MDHVEEGIVEDINSEVQDVQYSSESEAASESSECETQLNTSMAHTMTFKCIGSNHSFTSQAALKAITELPGDVKQVPVMMRPEPDNPVDSEAIAFVPRLQRSGELLGMLYEN